MYKTVLNTNVERLYVIYDQILKCLVNLLYIYIYIFIYTRNIYVLYIYMFLYIHIIRVVSGGFSWL